MRQSISGGARRSWFTGAALIAAAALPLSAQGTGNGYLFGAPTARVTLRAGYAAPIIGGDFFNEELGRFTLSKGDFRSATLGGELGFRLRPRSDISFSIDYAGVTGIQSEYRHFFENTTPTDSLPVRQSTSFQRVPLIANVRLYLVTPGRSVGRLAWIPTKVVPWLEAGIGGAWYRFRQEGDFVDETAASCVNPLVQSCPIYTRSLSASGWGPALRGAGGVDFSLSPRIAASGGARYIWSQASMGGNYEGNTIDLSSLAFTLGVTFRL